MARLSPLSQCLCCPEASKLGGQAVGSFGSETGLERPPGDIEALGGAQRLPTELLIKALRHVDLTADDPARGVSTELLSLRLVSSSMQAIITSVDPTATERLAGRIVECAFRTMPTVGRVSADLGRSNLMRTARRLLLALAPSEPPDYQGAFECLEMTLGLCKELEELTLELGGRDIPVGSFLSLKRCTTITRLIIAGAQYWDCPWGLDLSPLRRLQAFGYPRWIDPEAAGSPPGSTEVEVECTGTPAGLVAAMALMPRQLKSLQLPATALGWKGVKALLAKKPKRGLRWPREMIEVLCLSHNPLGGKGCRELRIPQFTSLKELDLSKTNMDDEDVVALGMHENQTMVKLSLDRNRITAAGVAAMKLGRHPRLQMLSLRTNCISDPSSLSLEANTSLKSVRIGNNGLSSLDFGLASNTTLETLEFTYPFGKTAAPDPLHLVAFSEQLASNRTLGHLELTAWQLDEAFLQHLKLGKGGGLKRLDLRCRTLTNETVRRMELDHSTLEEVHLYGSGDGPSEEVLNNLRRSSKIVTATFSGGQT